eukprot:63177_1
MAAEEQHILSLLAANLLSNKITSDAVLKLLKSVEPNGPRWFVYQCRLSLGIHLTIEVAVITLDFAADIKVYDLQQPFKLPNDASLFNLYPRQLTVCFWCKPRRLGNYQTILSTEPLPSRPRKYGWGFRFRRDGVFWFTPIGGHGYARATCASKTKVTTAMLNKWYFICGSYDSFNGNTRLYVNGIQECAATVDKSGLVSLQFTAGIGLQVGSLNTLGERFDGLIAEVRIYNKVLSSDEIQKCYKGFAQESSCIVKSRDLIQWNSKINDEWITWNPNLAEQNQIVCKDAFTTHGSH